MWRSNVLRLRKCSSAGGLRHGVTRRWYSPEKSLPVTEEEFQDALRSVLTERRTREARGLSGASVYKVPIGLAISGGVDSMALAFLYARAREADSFLPQAHGFVVDHKARPESTEEAHWVADQLRSRFDMQASVLTLAWPESYDMTDQKRFETEARAHRYQALGRACRDNRVNALMLAHHGDDQAETVLMRLSNHRVRTGLRAMQSVEWIPECEGIYGVHHSGSWDKHDPRQPRPSWRPPFPIEQGGIQILRPLLAMEKSRLVSTCEEHGVQWAEDKSNNDPTYTSRNAIRHMYSHHQMPKALSISSLVNLSMHMQKRVGEHRAYAKKLYDQCLFKLNVQTGSVIVRFPPFSSLLARPIQTESDVAEARNNAYYLLEQVADLVTPALKAATGQLDARLDCIYPEFLTVEDNEAILSAGLAHTTLNFTVGKVWWRKLGTASPFEEHGLPSVDYQVAQPHPREWLLTRQTMEDYEREKVQHVVPPSGHQGHNANEAFHFFDGRFWTKLDNRSPDSLILRAFSKADMAYLPTTQMTREAFRKRFGPAPERFITAAFAAIKPSDVRFTLPAVFRKDSTTGEESLVGFPTLNIRMGGVGPPLDVCNWTVRYKKIEFGSHAPEKIIVRLRNEEIINLEKEDRMANKGVMRLKLKRKRFGGEDLLTGYARSGQKGAQTAKTAKVRKDPWQDVVRDVEKSMGDDESGGIDGLEGESKSEEQRKQ